MGPLVWDAKIFGLNIDDMDNEHQVLIKKMNVLHDLANAKGIQGAHLDRAFEDLIQFTAKHFADEEALMSSFSFQGLATHKVIHQQLLARLHEHHNEFKIKGVISQACFDFLHTWLTSHIRGIDTKYAREYLAGGSRKSA